MANVGDEFQQAPCNHYACRSESECLRLCQFGIRPHNWLKALKVWETDPERFLCRNCGAVSNG